MWIKKNADGTIQSANIKHDGFKNIELDKDKNGEIYSHYDKNFKPDFAKINQVKNDKSKGELDKKRDEELKGFEIDSFFLNKEIIKDMAVAHSVMGEGLKTQWINNSNEIVAMTKEEMGNIIKKGTKKVAEIYFKYRIEKDKIDDLSEL